MTPGPLARAVRGLAAAGAAVAAYTLVVPPRYLRWGTTDVAIEDAPQGAAS
jgi:hypothetical protein